jgi:hypothetical protein
LRGGPRRFRPGFPCPVVLRYPTRKAMRFRIRGFYPLWRRFPPSSANAPLCNFPTALRHDHAEPYNPGTAMPAGLAPSRFGLFPFRSPLLRESMFLSSPPATKMFQFAGLPPLALCVQARVPAHYHGWVSPFGDPRINAWSAAPRGLSQPPTSFIGSRCQGIHRVPLFT